MGKAPAFQFYVKDWLSDIELQMTSASTRGIWMNFLCHMWSSRIRGELQLSEDQFIKFGNCSKGEMEIFLKENEALGFCYIKCNSNGNSIIRNRRMYKEEKSKELNRLRQKRYYYKNKPNAEPNADITPPSPSPSPIIKKSGFKKPFKNPQDDYRHYPDAEEVLRKKGMWPPKKAS